ncbi:hypothetical protein SKAU_G00251810 [Synaphobranchus kaupii]|uniref:Uncharacterized protein n=1 Tax=Synaphobranchus kaupii TaxID=118154 RepID=A0A9Q1F372_SYNKA|nr:hypothetical protein SKAU_G00251810 [Synaphobranchus kaupii]
MHRGDRHGRAARPGLRRGSLLRSRELVQHLVPVFQAQLLSSGGGGKQGAEDSRSVASMIREAAASESMRISSSLMEYKFEIRPSSSFIFALKDGHWLHSVGNGDGMFPTL